MDAERSVASATARSSGNFDRGEDSGHYHLANNRGRSGKVGKFRSLFQRDRNLSNKIWFNPEDFVAQKREWAKQDKDKDKVVGWPAHLFEQFLVVGLPPTTDVKSVITDAETAHTAKSGNLGDVDIALEPSEASRHRGPRGLPVEPQVLYSYPPDSAVGRTLPWLCFPHGVQPTLLERTPSMSSLNDLLYSQNYLNSDASSFIFFTKVAGNMPLYGVCCYMDEMLHRPPSMLKPKYPDCDMPLTRYMVAAPRCYCFLTHYPFFSLHMKVLHMILGLERLDRIMLFMDEVASMPLGGGRGLSGRLDSRKLPDLQDSNSNSNSKSRQAQPAQRTAGKAGDGSREENRPQPEHAATAGILAPSLLGSHRSSMPELRNTAPPPPTSGGAFPLNPHQSYDEAWGTMGNSPQGHDHDVFQSPRKFLVVGDQTGHTNGPSPNATPVGVRPDWTHLASPFEAPSQVPDNTSPPKISPAQLGSGFHSSSSAPAGPMNGFPATPERQLVPSTSKSNLNSPAQGQLKSPASKLARASARMRGAIEASQTLAKANAGPADPPPRQPGLPRGSGHRRTHSQQAPSSNVPPTGGHRHTLSHPQPPPYPGAPPPSDLTPEPSRASEGSLEGYATAQSTFSESLSHVQQHIRRLSAQSLSGFSDADTPRHAEAPTASQGADSLIQADPSHMGASQGGHMQPQHQQIDRNAVQQGGGHAWGAAQQQPCDRLINAVDWGRGPNPGAPSQQNSGSAASASLFAGDQQQVPSQWQTFDQQAPHSQQGSWQQGQMQQPQSGFYQPQIQGVQQASWQQPSGPLQRPWPSGQGQLQHQQLGQVQQQPFVDQRGQDQREHQSWLGQNQAHAQQLPGQLQHAPWAQGIEQPLWSQPPSHQSGPYALPVQNSNQHPWAAQQHPAQQAQQQSPWNHQQQSGASIEQPQWQQPQQAQQQAPDSSLDLPPAQHAQQAAGPFQGAQPSPGQLQATSSGVPLGQFPEGQFPVGQLQGTLSGMPVLEHRSTRAIRTTSFRQVVRSASEGDAMALQTDPATALQVMQAYHMSPVPQPGQEFEFCPDPSLQPVHFLRSRSSEGLTARYVHGAAEAAIMAEAAEGLSSWCCAAVCCSLSLENILVLISGIMLERNTVVFCPNIGLLSTCVLSLIPLLRPFSWQHFLMPVLPDTQDWLDLLDNPTPFVVGIQYKTSEIRAKCAGFMRVNVYKDNIKTSGHLPSLPNEKALLAALQPAYAILSAAGKQRLRGRPIYTIGEDQKAAADTFLQVLQDHLGSIVGDLNLHTITDVNGADRVSILLEDSFIDSFPPRDRTFVKQFVETQTFKMYTDSVIR